MTTKKSRDEQRKYVELVASMSVDCLNEGITYETFLSNLEMIVMQLKHPREALCEER